MSQENSSEENIKKFTGSIKGIRIAGFATALVTGATYPGENEKVDL